MQPPSPRYAIYFTPRPSTPLAQFGMSILGYDSSAGQDVPRFVLKDIAPADLAAATLAPRKYGFHATLAAPFYLGTGHAEADLVLALDALSRKIAPVDLGHLTVDALGDFIALTPVTTSSVNDLARACVTCFDGFRAPPTPHDLVRRDSGLTPRQRENLARWGYPYVFDDFRFHMTLTGALGPDERKHFFTALTEAFAPLADQPYEVEAISLMRQADSQSGFKVMARKDLQGRTQ